MNKKLLMFTAVMVLLCLCLFLPGGCALKELMKEEDEAVENGENGSPGPGESSEEEAGPAQGNSAGNILNGGLVAMQGSEIYYGSPADGGKLYRAGLDGSGRMKLSDDVPQYINATEQYIYYVAMGEPETFYDELMGEEFTFIVYGPIVRIDLDGGGRTVISPDRAANLQLVEGRLYYYGEAGTENPKIYCIEADGSGKELLTDSRADFFNVEGGSLYYRGFDEKPQLCKADLESGGRSMIYGGDAYFMNILDDNIYFVGDIFETEIYLGGRSLYRMGLSGGVASRVGDVEPAFLNCGEGWLYYSKAHSGEICRIRPDGSAQEQLSSDYCGGIFIFDEWMYYINIDDGKSLYRMGLDGSGRTKVD